MTTSSFRTTLDDLWEQGIRPDGRKASELRQIHCQLGVFRDFSSSSSLRPSGSAAFSFGNTQVVAAIYGPHEPRSGQSGGASAQVTQQSAVQLMSGGAAGGATPASAAPTASTISLTCEYSSACFASTERSKSSTKSDRKSLEYSSILRSLLDLMIVSDALTPGTVLDSYVELLQDDGGSLSTCVNALTCALADARIPIRDYVVAVTVGVGQGGVVVVDKGGGVERGVEVTIGVMGGEGGDIVLLEQEKGTLPVVLMGEVIKEGLKGCARVYKEVVGVVKGEVV